MTVAGFCTGGNVINTVYLALDIVPGTITIASSSTNTSNINGNTTSGRVGFNLSFIYSGASINIYFYDGTMNCSTLGSTGTDPKIPTSPTQIISIPNFTVNWNPSVGYSYTQNGDNLNYTHTFGGGPTVTDMLNALEGSLNNTISWVNTMLKGTNYNPASIDSTIKNVKDFLTMTGFSNYNMLDLLNELMIPIDPFRFTNTSSPFGVKNPHKRRKKGEYGLGAAGATAVAIGSTVSAASLAALVVGGLSKIAVGAAKRSADKVIEMAPLMARDVLVAGGEEVGEAAAVNVVDAETAAPETFVCLWSSTTIFLLCLGFFGGIVIGCIPVIIAATNNAPATATPNLSLNQIFSRIAGELSIIDDIPYILNSDGSCGSKGVSSQYDEIDNPQNLWLLNSNLYYNSTFIPYTTKFLSTYKIHKNEYTIYTPLTQFNNRLSNLLSTDLSKIKPAYINSLNSILTANFNYGIFTSLPTGKVIWDTSYNIPTGTAGILISGAEICKIAYYTREKLVTSELTYQGQLNAVNNLLQNNGLSFFKAVQILYSYDNSVFTCETTLFKCNAPIQIGIILQGIGNYSNQYFILERGSRPTQLLPQIWDGALGTFQQVKVTTIMNQINNSLSIGTELYSGVLYAESVISSIPTGNIVVPTGFPNYSQADQICTFLKSVLDNASPGNPIYLFHGGHSLGGGLVACNKMMIAQVFNTYLFKGILKYKCITYAGAAHASLTSHINLLSTNQQYSNMVSNSIDISGALGSSYDDKGRADIISGLGPYNFTTSSYLSTTGASVHLSFPINNIPAVLGISSILALHINVNLLQNILQTTDNTVTVVGVNPVSVRVQTYIGDTYNSIKDSTLDLVKCINPWSW